MTLVSAELAGQPRQRAAPLVFGRLLKKLRPVVGHRRVVAVGRHGLKMSCQELLSVFLGLSETAAAEKRAEDGHDECGNYYRWCGCVPTRKDAQSSQDDLVVSILPEMI